MTTIIGITIGVLLSAFIAYFTYRFLLGKQIAQFTRLFAYTYDNAISNQKLKQEAFSLAIEAFYPCYPFCKLSPQEWQNVINTFSALNNPKDKFIHMITFYSAAQVMNCLRNPKFLNELKT